MNDYGLTNTPLWIDEFNISPEDYDDPYRRGWSAHSAAYGAATFIKLANLNLLRPIVLVPFEFIAVGPDNRLIDIDWETGEPKIPYWRNYLLGQHFGDSKTILKINQVGDAVDVLAMQDSAKVIKVLISNARTSNTSIFGGYGPKLMATVRINNSATEVNTVHELNIDSTFEPTAAPVKKDIEPLSSNSFQIQLNGHGMSVLIITLK